MGLDLQIRTRNGLPTPTPVVRCDACGEAITDARDGRFTWSADPIQPTPRIYFVHKGPCACAFTDDGSEGESWSELILFPALLAESLGIELADSRSILDDASRCKACRGLVMFMDSMD